jgi:branched-chain amino acid transport system ATP-binding protein
MSPPGRPKGEYRSAQHGGYPVSGAVPRTPPPKLRVRGLRGGYGRESEALFGVDFDVPEGACVALLGRNGAGRTTTLRGLMGLLPRCTGSVQLEGQEILGLAPHQIALRGVGYCPEERGIYAGLSCEENLLLPPGVPGATGMPLAEIYQLFPNLAERRRSPGTRLSGGEQQMLALARILRTGARLLLLDEISEGLAPAIVQALARLVRQLKARGYTIVLVEQNLHFAAPLADRLVVIEHGRVVANLTQDEYAAQGDALQSLLVV